MYMLCFVLFPMYVW